MSTTAGGDAPESLSDIDDAEVAGYLHSKEATLFKRMIWEVMNKDYDKGKSRKRARKAKKAVPAKKPEKAATTVMDAKKRLSSKINFDAFSKLNEGLGDSAPGSEEGRESNCGSHGDMHLSNEKNTLGGSHDDKFEHESEEAAASQGYDDDTYFANNEYNGYDYDDKYTFDEFDS